MSEQTAQPSQHLWLTRRPEVVTDLIWEREVSAEWFTINKEAKRFFVVGVADVMAHAGITANAAPTFFQNAKTVIQDETQWPSQYNFRYECSNIQIRKNRIKEPRTFGKSAGLIVGLELAARHTRPDFNVYPNLCVLCADYFIDRFNSFKLEALREEHAKWSDEQKLEKFADPMFRDQDLSRFDDVCSIAIKHWAVSSPITDLATGKTGTKTVCQDLVDFVHNYYPAPLHVGPVRTAGENRSDEILGSLNASDKVRVPSSLSNLAKVG